VAAAVAVALGAGAAVGLAAGGAAVGLAAGGAVAVAGGGAAVEVRTGAGAVGVAGGGAAVTLGAGGAVGTSVAVEAGTWVWAAVALAAGGTVDVATGAAVDVGAATAGPSTWTCLRALTPPAVARRVCSPGATRGSLKSTSNAPLCLVAVVIVSVEPSKDTVTSAFFGNHFPRTPIVVSGSVTGVSSVSRASCAAMPVAALPTGTLTSTRQRVAAASHQTLDRGVPYDGRPMA
jgi:hypothetical protein